MYVKDIMLPAKSVNANTTVAEAAKIMAEHNMGSIFIESHGKIGGIMTERDIVQKIAARGIDSRRVMVYEIMSSPIISIPGNTLLEEASDLMAKHRIRRLAVVENGKIVGKVTSSLIARNMKYYLSVKLFRREESPKSA